MAAASTETSNVDSAVPETEVFTENDGNIAKDESISEDEVSSSAAAENPLMPGESEPTGLINEDGEINWDCPCLQGMADGPCGAEFKDAFSCFHYSEEEPKGANCIEQFTAMQKCFFQYPEIYGGIDDEIEEGDLPKDSETTEDTSEKVSIKENISEEKIDTLVENVTEKLENTSLPES